MAAVFKKKYPIPMPDGAEIFQRRGKAFARWTNGKGQERTAEVLDNGRVQFVSDYWYVRYNDADGKMRRQSTGCRDKQAAEKKLVDILVQLDKIRVGVISQEEMAAVAHSEKPIARHTKHYLEDLSVRTIRGRRISPKHVWNVGQALARVVRECGFKTLKDIDRRSVQRWMDKTVTTPRKSKKPDSKPLSPRTVNMHRSAIMAFCNWCVLEGRLMANPLAGLPKAQESELMRNRRPLTSDEIACLLKAARERPLRDALTIRRGRNKGKPLAKVSQKERRRLERVGRQRSLLYKFMMLTGLRRGEVASLTVRALQLDEANPYVCAEGKHAKSGRAATLPLRADLAEELREHVEQRCKADGQDAPLFDIDWRNLLRRFDLDLSAAGIPKRDAHGRTVDVHCLRHTFQSLRRRAWRMSVTSLRGRAELASLAALCRCERVKMAALFGRVSVTLSVLPGRGGDRLGARRQSVDVHSCRWCHLLAKWPGKRGVRVTLCVWRAWQRKTPGDNGCHLLASQRASGFEPPTSSLGSWHSTTELRPRLKAS